MTAEETAEFMAGTGHYSLASARVELADMEVGDSLTVTDCDDTTYLIVPAGDGSFTVTDNWS
jgi:hypothetical protein